MITPGTGHLQICTKLPQLPQDSFVVKLSEITPGAAHTLVEVT